MRLLFDESLAPGLIATLADLFPGSLHVRDADLKAASDTHVWEFAKKEGFVIISKDSDFHQRSLVLGPPPKVIGLLVGNCPTAQIATLVRTSEAIIRRFEEDPAASFLALP